MAASKLMTLRQPVGGKREFGTASSTPTKQTFRSDIEGLRAVAVLVNQIGGAPVSSEEMLFQPELVVRGSTGPVAVGALRATAS